MTIAANRQTRFWEFLDQGLFQELGIPVLIVSLVLFVSAMTLLGANVSELRSGYARVQQTNAALLQIANLNNDILRDDMIVRGYALSGDPIYLTWQTMAKKAMNARLVALDKLLADDPDQHAEMQELKELVAAHIATFDRLAGLVPTDRARVIAEIVDYGKKVKRRPIENMLAHLRGDQSERLAERQSGAETRVVNAYRYAIGISSLALLLGAIGFALVIHDRRAGRRRRVRE